MQQFLYQVRAARVGMVREGPTPREAEIVAAHFAYLQALVADGVALMAGHTLNNDDHTFGLVIFRAETEEGAREIMQKDPAVKEAVMRAELFPFRVALWSATGPS